MKRLAAIIGLIACVAVPAAAQWEGMPAWNNPKGGTGITVNGDLGLPNTDAGKGTAFGARATLGLANLSFTAGVASWKPKGAPASTTSVGGVAQFRAIGGSLIPTGLNIEPYVSISNRWHKPSGGSSESNIGWVVGANIGLGMLCLHVAYDSEKLNSGATAGVLGIGVHVALKAPIGM